MPLDMLNPATEGTARGVLLPLPGRMGDTNSSPVPQPVNGFRAFDMADCITSGLVGRELRDALHRHFPSATRAEVYEAIGIAMSMVEVDLIVAEAERDEALRLARGGPA